MTNPLQPGDLEACPFCGSADIVLRHSSDMPGWDEDCAAHQCRKCEAIGPTLTRRSEGPDWNTRAALSAPSREGGLADILTDAEKLLVVASRAAAKMQVSLLRHEIEPRAEFDALVDHRTEFSECRRRVTDLLTAYRAQAQEPTKDTP